jgi:predicted RNA-binding Zn ribbon-like protein
MKVRDEYLWIGGHPALDFVNTEIARDGEPVDLLDTPDALARWLAEARLVSSARSVVVNHASFAAAKRTRAALREIAGALAGGHPPPRAAIARIGEELRRGRGALALNLEAGRFTVSFEPEHPIDPRFLLARAAAEFLAGADPRRIRRCEGTNCILFFYDATKSATRRWCSMAACGNRMKAALHYERKRRGK